MTPHEQVIGEFESCCAGNDASSGWKRTVAQAFYQLETSRYEVVPIVATIRRKLEADIAVTIDTLD
ncbi:hypothetical protein [Saccharopolyspora tripterygii]